MSEEIQIKSLIKQLTDSGLVTPPQRKVSVTFKDSIIDPDAMIVAGSDFPIPEWDLDITMETDVEGKVRTINNKTMSNDETRTLVEMQACHTLLKGSAHQLLNTILVDKDKALLPPLTRILASLTSYLVQEAGFSIEDTSNLAIDFKQAILNNLTNKPITQSTFPSETINA
jgi:hypothetical protein